MQMHDGMRLHILWFYLTWRFCQSCTDLDSGESTKSLFGTDGFPDPPPGPPEPKPNDPGEKITSAPTDNSDNIASIFVSKKDSLPVFLVGFDQPSEIKRKRKAKNNGKTVLVTASNKSANEWNCEKPQMEAIEWANKNSPGYIVMGHARKKRFLVVCGVKLANNHVGCQKLSDGNWVDIKAPFPNELIPKDNKNYEQLNFVFTYKGIWTTNNLFNQNNITWILNLTTEDWHKSITLPDIRSEYCLVSRYFQEEDDTMIIGGIDQNKEDLKSVYQWSWNWNDTHKWELRSEMLDARHAMACGWNDKKVYVVGGLNKEKYVNMKENVMVFDDGSDKWEYGISLNLDNNFKKIDHHQIYFYYGSPLIIWKKKFIYMDPSNDKWDYMDEEQFPPFTYNNSIVTEVVGNFIPDTCHEVKNGENITETMDEDGECWKYPCKRPHDCAGLYSGITEITIPVSRRRVRVRCYEEGIVIQNRGQFGNPVDFFDKGWADYQNGFGIPEKEFWIGLDNLHLLTTHQRYQLHITMFGSGLYSGQKKIAMYDQFSVEGSMANYRLSVGGFSSPVGDTKVPDSLNVSNGYPFTTKDRDNDQHDKNCADIGGGGWWFNACYESMLNGYNVPSDGGGQIHTEDRKPIFWRGFGPGWGKDGQSLSKVIMAIHQVL